MCAILGLFNNPDAGKKALLSLETLQNRGLDSFGLTDNKNVVLEKSLTGLEKASAKTSLNGNCILAHCLHSIIGFVPEPFLITKG
ncbi:MAG: hypothetical protein V1718_04220, partial [archaeon]